MVMVASGQLEPEYPTQIHFEIGGKKGDSEMGGEDLLERYWIYRGLNLKVPPILGHFHYIADLSYNLITL